MTNKEYVFTLIDELEEMEINSNLGSVARLVNQIVKILRAVNNGR